MGRHPSNEPLQYQIQQLHDLHHEILRRLVVGQKTQDIARDLNITPVTVTYVKNSEIGKRQLSVMRSAADVSAVDVAGHIKQLAAKAVGILESALELGPTALGMRAAFDVLDRAGFGAPRIVRTENVHAHLTREDIEELKHRAKLEGVVVDAVLAEECG